MAKGAQVTPRQIVGLSLPPHVAREFKAEASRRGISARALFQELWASYKPSLKAHSE